MPTGQQWTALSDSLKQQVRDVNKYSDDFGRLRLWSKGMLILLSAVVAAGKTFAWVPHYEGLIAVLAVVVAILTAADAWIKPAEKWRISSTYATQFDSLYRRVQGVDKNDQANVEKLDHEFKDLQKAWLTDTTY